MNPAGFAHSHFRVDDGRFIPFGTPAALNMHAHHTNDLHATASRFDVALKILICIAAALAGLTLRLVLRR